MTIEEKAKAYDKILKAAVDAYKYDKALKAAVVAYKDEDKHLKATLETIFPELKERVDSERIRGAIIDIIKSQKEQQCHIDSTIYDEMIAWLGKQVEPKPFDKVEPKFKVGDCVVNKFGDSWHIVSLDKKNYQVSDEKGNYIYFPISKQDEMRPKYKFIIGDIISNGKVEYRVDNIVKNCIGQDCYFLVNIESEKDGTRYLKLSDSNGKTHNMGEITWLCEQVDAKFEKQCKQTISQTNERAWLYLVADVLTWKDGIGQYLDDPRVQQLAKKLCSEYEQKLYTSPKGKTNCFTD